MEPHHSVPYGTTSVLGLRIRRPMFCMTGPYISGLEGPNSGLRDHYRRTDIFHAFSCLGPGRVVRRHIANAERNRAHYKPKMAHWPISRDVSRGWTTRAVVPAMRLSRALRRQVPAGPIYGGPSVGDRPSDNRPANGGPHPSPQIVGPQMAGPVRAISLRAPAGSSDDMPSYGRSQLGPQMAGLHMAGPSRALRWQALIR